MKIYWDGLVGKSSEALSPERVILFAEIPSGRGYWLRSYWFASNIFIAQCGHLCGHTHIHKDCCMCSIQQIENQRCFVCAKRKYAQKERGGSNGY